MRKLKLLQKYTDIQAHDRILWAFPKNDREIYIMDELRKLVWMIEEATDEEIDNEFRKYGTRLGLKVDY